MTKKLSKAQVKEFERIKAYFERLNLDKELEYYDSRAQKAKDEHWRDWYLEHKQMYLDGWVLWDTKNWKTLKILEENGLIDYKKSEYPNWRVAIDWVRIRKGMEA